MRADRERDDRIPDGEIHAATIATVDPGARTCTVLLPGLDGGDGRTPDLPYDPHVAVGDDGLHLEHPERDDRAVVLEDNTGGLWVAQWTRHA